MPFRCPRCDFNLPIGEFKFCPECGYKFKVSIKISARTNQPPPLPNPEPLLSREFKLSRIHKFGIGFLVFICLIILPALFSDDPPKYGPSIPPINTAQPIVQTPFVPPPTPNSTPFPVLTPEPSPTPRPTPTPTWRKVKIWEGNATKNTESFIIGSDEWAIQWQSFPGRYGRGHFSIVLHNAETNEYMDLIVNRSEPGQDISYMRQSGNFYFEIGGDDHPWRVMVSELK